MEIREMRNKLGNTQSEFAARYNIPFRTIQNWEAGIRKPPDYVIRLLEHQVNEDIINRKTDKLPVYDSKKMNLPQRSEYHTSADWLRAVQERMGGNVVFALDEALMCQGSFGGRSDEYLIWVYGDDSLARFNGVVILGNHLSDYVTTEKNGIRFTDLNRTLSDALANESILDMQGITEAVSRYYYSHEESFTGLSVAPEYQNRFEQLAEDAIHYYDN